MGAPTLIELLEGEPPPRAGTTVYRALRAGAPYAFVVVGGDGGAAYDVVHEDGVPDGAEGVTLIDPFDVSADDEGAFLADWRAVRATLAAHRGYQGTRLYRAAGPAAPRYVALSRWSSPLAFARAAGGASVAHPPMYLLVRR